MTEHDTNALGGWAAWWRSGADWGEENGYIGHDRALAAAWYNWRVSPPAADVFQLTRSLFEPLSLMDRLRSHDPRIATLEQIAQSREIRVLLDLLTLLAVDEGLAPHVGRTIAALAGELSPAQLAWIDDELRRGWRADHGPGAWRRLTPQAVSRLAQRANLDVIVIGLIASHASGFVRAAALDALAHSVDGREIPFLSLRANDWVHPVAARAHRAADRSPAA